ncbi:MAG: hypothetical protein KF745_14210 [Phycisphaeraceae bacterium]|nr:hypothetical protein [Phycisphaeraceae bacterium]
MNSFVAWLKTNWVIAVLAVVALAVLPASIFVSSGMDATLRETMQKKVSDDFNAVSKDKLEYAVKSPVVPGESLIKHSDAPNEKLIQYFAEARTRTSAEAAEVWSTAVEFNKKNHSVLIEGVFPAPSELDKQSKPVEFAKTLVRTIAPALLKAIDAGMPPDGERLAARLKDQYDRLHNAQLATAGGQELSEQANKKIVDELVQLRLGEYRRRASEIRVYADAAVFTDLPATAPTSAPSLRQAWEWQEQIWALEDLVAAIASVNDSGRGATSGVPGSVIKRIIKATVGPVVSAQGGGDPSFPGASAAPKSDGITSLLVPDFGQSITGRTSGVGSGNMLYDVRFITLNVVTSTRRLPQFIDALAQTNFAAVVGCELRSVDTHADLEQGFYYGDEHVVEASLKIETVWFRDWTTVNMPEEIRVERTGVSAADATISAPVAPPPRAAPPPPDEGGGKRGGRRAIDLPD